MAVYAGPEIVTNGLTMHLDAANPQSYVGTGTVWRDIAQGLTLNSYGSQTSWGVVAGARAFTFNGSGYWQMDSGSSNVPLGGDCTIILWVYEVTRALRTTIFQKAGTIYQPYEQEIAITWEVSQVLSWYSRYSPQYDVGSTSACDTNKWNMMAIKMSTGLTAASRSGFYSKNGAPWVQNYTSRTNVALVNAGALQIGTGYSGAVTAGSIGLVSCYNRMLSDAEIAQNFYATRGRFGI